MKIIGVDNFGRDNVSEVLVADNISNMHYANCMADALNAEFCADALSSTFYKVVPDTHKLYKWEP